MTRPVVWTIAGSDPRAGAGLQADLLSFNDFSVEGRTVVAALTAQNSQAVLRSEAVSNDWLDAQIDALLVDDLPAVIKIGLIGSPQQASHLAQRLAQLKQQQPRLQVVYDPVAVASNGGRLAHPELLSAVQQQLLAQVDVITPNALELAELTGHAVVDLPSLAGAARALYQQYGISVLAKGGHLAQQDAVDYLISRSGEYALSSPTVTHAGAHGTGCTLASALAAALAHNYPLEDAFVLAKAYVNQGLGEHAAVRHLGFPQRKADFPQVVLAQDALGLALGLTGQLTAGVGFAKTAQRLGLYPVVDSLAWVERLLGLGVRTLQLRIKDKQPAEVEADIAQAIALAKAVNARLFINDYWQLAIKHQAYGVHLGQEDMDVADLGAIAKAGLRLGLSTHGYYELLRAERLAPSYIALGHIFPTTTKQMPSSPQGLNRLRAYAALTALPTVAIGGIDLARAAAVWQCGVGSLAVVRAITQCEDPATVISAFNQVMDSPHVNGR